MAEQESRAVNDKCLATAPQEQFKRFEQFLLHALKCEEPNCLLPLCVNTKLMFSHTKGCTNTSCSVCQQMRYLASKHSESCKDIFCSIPFCMQSKLKTFVESQVDQSERSDAASENQRRQALTAYVSSISGGNNSRPAPQTMSFKKTAKGYPTTSSQERKMASNQTVARVVPKAPASFKSLSVYSQYPPGALKRTSGSTAANTKVTSPTKLPRRNLEQHQCQKEAKQIATVALSQANAFMGPISESHDRSFTTISKTTPYLPVKVPNSSSMGTDNKITNTKSCLLKARFFQALLGLLRLVMKAKTRGELLICIGSLRSALHEIKTLGQM